jgi:3-oxoacyl-[acyl-carrier protein] reductase
MTDLTGKVALVTGGSRGIGAAVVRRLAGQGAAVAFTYHQSEERARAVASEVEAAGGRALAIRADNRDAAAVEAAVDRVLEAFGRLDILVNNAGVFDVAPIDELTLDRFDRTVEVNVRAVFAASRAAARVLPEGGRIISIGSNLAQRVPAPGISLYALSKAALVGFTKGLARDLGARGITVNVVHPGSTDTDMNPADGESADLQRGLMAIPRFNEADDVAGLVAWLAGPQGRALTGSELLVDAGANA